MVLTPTNVNNLHEFGPQSEACVDTLDDEDGNPILDEGSTAFCAEEVAILEAEFQFKITTDDISYQLPLQQNKRGGGAAVYNFEVDWGNGESDTITSWNQAEANHAYFGDTGEFTITITGDLGSFGHPWGGDNLGDKDMITEFTAWGNLTTHDIDAWYEMFYDCANMTYEATDAPDFTGVTEISFLFQYCYLLGTSGDFSLWDVSGITDMDGMFEFALDFDNNTLNDWNVSSVIYFGAMFGGTSMAISSSASFVSWDVSSCIDFGAMFYSTGVVDGFSGWDVSNGVDFGGMFFDSLFNEDLSSWDVSNSDDFASFLRNTNISVANYDLLLNAWSLLTFVNTALPFRCDQNYTIATSQAARDILTSAPNSWVILDSGGI